MDLRTLLVLVPSARAELTVWGSWRFTETPSALIFPGPLHQAGGSQRGMVISHHSQADRNEGGFVQLMSVRSTWRSPLGFGFSGGVVSADFWVVKSGCLVEKIGKCGSLECSAQSRESSFSSNTNPC